MNNENHYQEPEFDGVYLTGLLFKHKWYLIAVFVLLAGHALNIVLGLMSIIVHGVRLNMLEFSGHLGMEWSGKEYAPFKE